MTFWGDRPIGEQLVAALSLGGSFTTTRGSVPGERQFCAPYVYSAFPADYTERDREGNPSVLIEKDVDVRSRPDDRAQVVAHLSYHLVFPSPVVGTCLAFELATTSPTRDATPMTPVRTTSVGENVPDRNRDRPNRNSHIPPIVTSQNDRTDAAAAAHHCGGDAASATTNSSGEI
jgi:hypothetical protein